MGSAENKSRYEISEKIFQMFKDFLTRVAKLEELVTVGGRLLHDFQQGLEFLRRPPINTTSELMKNIIKVNETKRLKSYVEAGCMNSHDSVQSMSKLHTCLSGLRNHLIKAKSILGELECLLEDMAGAIKTTGECLSPSHHGEMGNQLDGQATVDKDEMASHHLQEPEIADYAVLMGIIYSMLKQDYVMQEKIVTSVNLKSLSGELQSYNTMWSLRPFVNDEIMHRAWRLFP